MDRRESEVRDVVQFFAVFLFRVVIVVLIDWFQVCCNTRSAILLCFLCKVDS